MIKIEDKRGLELAISTIILIILGILVLIGLVLILAGGWDNFKMYIGGILGSEVSQARKMCRVQCDLGNEYDYCCEKKEVNNMPYTCQDDSLKTACNINCSKLSCVS